MIALRFPLSWLVLAGAAVWGQPAATPAPASGVVPLSASTENLRTAEELERLVAPIALYPDALIALILPAATAPADVVLAARFLRESGANAAQIEQQPWDESVRSLAHYPDVLKWMDENLEWTKQVGEAFSNQPVEVMQAVQRLRAKAQASGTLVSSPQQQVLTDFDVIRIVPAQDSLLYVPYYDPALVFVDRPWGYARPFVGFGVGLPVGSWLAFECDWRRHRVWVGDRHRHWGRHDWRQPVVPIPVVAPPYGTHRGVRPWRPPPHTVRPPASGPRPPPATYVRPAPPSAPPPNFATPTPPVPPPAAPPRRGRRNAPAPASTTPGQPTAATTVQAAAAATAPASAAPAVTSPTPPASPTPATTVRRRPSERGAPPSSQGTTETPPRSRASRSESSAAATAGPTAPPASPRSSPSYQSSPGRSASPPPAATGSRSSSPPSHSHRSSSAPAPSVQRSSPPAPSAPAAAPPPSSPPASSAPQRVEK